MQLQEWEETGKIRRVYRQMDGTFSFTYQPPNNGERLQENTNLPKFHEPNAGTCIQNGELKTGTVISGCLPGVPLDYVPRGVSVEYRESLERQSQKRASSERK